MLIHSYVTDGYYDFAVSLIESFKDKHGEDTRFLLHSKGLSKEQIDNLYGRYKNLTIRNSEIDWAWLERKSGMNRNQLKQGKQQVETLGNRYMSKQFYHWKHYISIYSRYRDAIVEAFDFAEEGERIIHMDADLYINRRLDPVFNLLDKADVALVLRPGYSPEWRKMYGCLMGFRVNDQSRAFHKKVCTLIHQPDFKNIPKGYGQIVFWRAYKELEKSNIKIVNIPKTWIFKGFNDKALILSANNGQLKRKTAKQYREMARKKEKSIAHRHKKWKFEGDK